MKYSFIQKIFYILFILTINTNLCSLTSKSENKLNEHTIVVDASVFPYMAAILEKTRYLSCGALIDESWVLTAADSLYTVRESSRTLRVRLGTTNYKRGGFLSPIKLLEIHPSFTDSKPLFDLALIKLAKPVKLSPTVNPISYLKRPQKVVAAHFTVTAWPPFMSQNNSKIVEQVHVNRAMSVSHLHPTDPERCAYELETIAPDHNASGLCLDPGVGSDPCQRDTGAPVVLNGILWGIISSWKTEDCEVEPIFVTLASDANVSCWIHSTVFGHKWKKEHFIYSDYNDNLV